MAKRLVTVIGATGMQGGSVVEYLLKDGSFSVRGVTRKTNEPKAKALAARGVEVVEGDNVTGSVDSLAKVFSGSYAAFLVSTFDLRGGAPSELEVGKKMVDAAKKAGVKHLFWSSLPDSEKESKGKYKVPHFTEKAHVEDYIESINGFEFVTHVRPAFYFSNLITMMAPKLEGDTLVFNYPDAGVVTGFDANEIGASVVTALKNPSAYNHKEIDYFGQSGTLADFAGVMGKVSGKKVQVNIIPLEIYAKFPFPGASELADMFGWFRDHTYYGATNDPLSGQKATPGGLANLESFLLRSGWKA